MILDIFLRVLFFIPVLCRKLFRKASAGVPGRILIIELWGIGDLAMMSGILRPLKEAFPQSRITLLSKENGRGVFLGNPFIDDFISFDFPWTSFSGKYKFWRWDWRGLFGTISFLRREGFDLVLDARGDPRNNLLAFLINPEKSLGFGWKGGGFLLTDCLRIEPSGLHRVEAWFKLLEKLGITAEPKTELYVSKGEEDEARSFLISNNIMDGDLAIGIHPGAAVKKRCWSMDNFALLGSRVRDKFRAKIIVFIEPDGYPQDFPMAGDTIKAKLSLRQLIAVIKRLDLLACNDSGAMHIASAVGTRAVAIFGPGDISLIGPYGEAHKVVMDKSVDCRPCFDNCRHNTAFCLDNVSVEQAEDAVEGALESSTYKH